MNDWNRDHSTILHNVLAHRASLLRGHHCVRNVSLPLKEASIARARPYILAHLKREQRAVILLSENEARHLQTGGDVARQQRGLVERVLWLSHRVGREHVGETRASRAEGIRLHCRVEGERRVRVDAVRVYLAYTATQSVVGTDALAGQALFGRVIQVTEIVLVTARAIRELLGRIALVDRVGAAITGVEGATARCSTVQLVGTDWTHRHCLTRIATPAR